MNDQRSPAGFTRPYLRRHLLPFLAALACLAAAALGAAGAMGRNIIASIVSFRFGARLRADLFRRVTSFSFQKLDSFDASSVITR